MQKLLIRMMMNSRDVVTSAYVAYMRKQNNNTEKGREYMLAHGFEIVGGGGPITADGRESFEVYGKRWALNPEAHAKALAERIEQAKAMQRLKEEAGQQRADKSHDPVAEGIAATTCPQMSSGKPCGGTLNRAPVCPSCVTGKMGYRYRYTCESCGCDIVTREELR